MALFDIEDYLKPYFNFNRREVGFRIGSPILSHEISKKPSIQPKWTKYDQQEVHNFDLVGIGADCLVIGFSFRRKQFIDFIGGRRESGETNCNAQLLVPLYVTPDHRIAVRQPFIRDVDCSSSGFGPMQLLDHMGTVLTFIVSGGQDQFGTLDMLAGIGALTYNFAALWVDPNIVTEPIQLSILSSNLTPYVNRIWDFDDRENEVYLSDIRYDPKGVWLIFSYPDWLQSAAKSFFNGMLFKGSDHPVYVIDNGLRRWIPNPDRFNALRYQWEAIIAIPDEDLASIEHGPNM